VFRARAMVVARLEPRASARSKRGRCRKRNLKHAKPRMPQEVGAAA
jgi:hypothetical protein